MHPRSLMKFLSLFYFKLHDLLSRDTKTLQEIIIGGDSGGGGAQRPPLERVGQFPWRTGRDDKKLAVFVRTQDGRTARLRTLILTM